jgi:sulfopyruvate decarboxylase TPP-binding subunit
MRHMAAQPATEPASGTRSIPAELLLAEIQALGVTHVLNVPDTHQKTLLALLARQEQPKLITTCSEDEALAMHAGLYVGGQRPMISIQNTGLCACMNAMRGVLLEGRIPGLLLIGLLHREPNVPTRESRVLTVRLTEPTLQAWNIPYYLLESEDDLHFVREAYERSFDERGPVVALLGARTA